MTKETWRIVWLKPARRELNKLDPKQRKLIEAYVDGLRELESPLIRAKRLTGDWSGCWRFEVGKYRLICEVFDDVLLIEILKVAKRDKVYD